MKKRFVFVSIIVAIILISGIVFFNCVKIDYDNIVRIPAKGNVIMDCNDLNITELKVNENKVYIEGELNLTEHSSLEAYIIQTVDVEKTGNVLYITVCGGYGTGEEKKKFIIDEQFYGEEIKKVFLKGRRFSSKMIWSATQ